MLRFFQKYYPIRNLFFILGEGIAIFSSVLISMYLLPGVDFFSNNNILCMKAALITFVCQMCLYYNELYDLKISEKMIDIGIRLVQALGVSSILLAIVYYIFPDAVIGAGVFALSAAISILLIVSWRFLYNMVLSRGIFNQKIVILGASKLAHGILHEISMRKDCGYTVSMIAYGKDPEYEEIQNTSTAILKKDFDDICALAKGFGAAKFIVAMSEKRGSFPARALLNCRMEGIEVVDGNSFYEMLTGKLMVETINPGWLIFSHGFRKSFFQRFFKRMIDVAFSAVLLVLFAPVILLIAVLVKLDSKGPVLFSQERIGKNGTKYIMYKFRSMVTDAEKYCGPKWAEKEDRRVTKVGKYLRKFRMDELPQLYNVIRGEMSFVGPRPEREHFIIELEKEIPYYRLRLSVKPGITGWAQVSYGYGATLEQTIEKLNYDLFYIKNISIWFDLMIVFQTLKIVIFGKGAR